MGVFTRGNNGYFAHGQATITGPTTLRPQNTKRRSIFIQNLGTGTLYVGGSGVLTTDGLKVDSGGDIQIDMACEAIIYVNATGTCDVRYMEELDQ